MWFPIENQDGASFLAIDTDYIDAVVLSESHLLFQASEHLLCSYYTMEATDLKVCGFCSTPVSLPQMLG